MRCYNNVPTARRSNELPINYARAPLAAAYFRSECDSTERSLAMSSGFNTDVQVGGRVFHVQTEDRGPKLFSSSIRRCITTDMVLYRHQRLRAFRQSAEFSTAGLYASAWRSSIAA